MDDNSEQRGRPGVAYLPTLKVPITVRFFSPTFPQLEMFIAPTLTTALARRWLLWMAERLDSFLKTGTPFFDQNMVVLFPDILPYWQLGLQKPDTDSLMHLHQEVCSLARMSVVLETTDRHGMRTSLELAIAKIHNTLEILSRHETPATVAPHRTELLTQHRQWFEAFKTFMNHNMESGQFSAEEIHAFADYRRCPISRWIYEEECQTWFIGRNEELRRVEADHKHLHATVHVEAHVAAQLRCKGLTSFELSQVKALIDKRIQNLAEEHQKFLDNFNQVFAEIANADDLPHTASKKGETLDFLPWGQLKKDVAEWKERIQRYVTAPRDEGMQGSLSHIGCPTGRRIEYALSDPALYFLSEFSLKLLDRAHMQLHATGTAIITLTQLGYTQDAFALFDTLDKEEKDLLGHLKLNAPLLKITNAA